jgi:predicted transposase YbfD/YdcC
MNPIDSIKNTSSIFQKFTAIEDPRLDRRKKYPLINILAYALIVTLSDQQSWYEIEAFSRSNFTWFSQFLDVSCGVPNHDTFRRVFSRLAPEPLEAVDLESDYDGSVRIRRRYYISSLDLESEDFMKIVRSHWSIENGLHRTLDVLFKEDSSQEHNRNAAANLSVLRKISLSLLKQIDPKNKLKLKFKEAAYLDNFNVSVLMPNKRI